LTCESSPQKRQWKILNKKIEVVEVQGEDQRLRKQPQPAPRGGFTMHRVSSTVAIMRPAESRSAKGTSMTITVTVAQGQGYRVGQRLYFGGQWLGIDAIFPLTSGAIVTGYNVVLTK
jgi:hypothetical protein